MFTLPPPHPRGNDFADALDAHNAPHCQASADGLTLLTLSLAALPNHDAEGGAA